MKKLLILFCGLTLAGFVRAKTVEVASPDGDLRLEIDIADAIRYSLHAGDDLLLERCELALETADGVLGEAPRLRSVKRTFVDELLPREFPTKNAAVRNRYNGATLRFAGDYAVEFRVFDDGAAYRFITECEGEMTVVGERCTVGLADNDCTALLSQTGGFRTMCEEPYTPVKTAEYGPDDRMSYLPVLVEAPKGRKLLLAESDVRDYPCMFVRGGGGNGFEALFPCVPAAYADDGDRSLRIVGEEPYIARTSGKRTFPWRIVAVASDDAQLLENELVYLLAEPCALADYDWVKPGQVSWDWWNGMQLTGVDFRAGRNTESYRYYIDFAARHGIPYIIMDEGWSASTRDVLHPNPELDLQELVAYGRERDVRIVLWLTWLAVEKDMERIFSTFADWGIAGVKIDFMDRSDQWMVDYYERVARCAASHRLFVDMHGSYTPKGLYRTYPNLLSYEGVLGLEQGGRCKPSNSNFLPYIRNVAGPMDFTPGSMFSSQPEENRSTGANPMGCGTRAYQMALYIVFESPLQMLADNPVLYEREALCTEFIASVPTTWDCLRVLRARCGKETVVARRKGEKWFIGGITAEEGYTTDLALDFLPRGRTFTLTSFEDGVNADRQAVDYRKRVREVDSSSVIPVTMVRNGGWAAVIE